MATGSYVYREAGYGQRLILTLTRSGNTVTRQLQLQCTGSMYARVPWSVSGSSPKSGTVQVSQGAAFTITLLSDSYTSAAAASNSASATMFWGGQPTVSASVGAAVAAPAAPTGLSYAASDGRNGALSWVKGARAADTGLQTAYDNEAWSTKWYESGTSKKISNWQADRLVWVRAFSRNVAGNSAYSNTITFYTTPSMPTNVRAALVDDGVKVTLQNNAKYPYGIEVEQEGGGTWSFGTGTGGSWSEATVPAQYGPDLRFKVRSFVGVGDNLVYSGWSDWSPPVQGLQAPLAPSALAPNGQYVSDTSALALSWRHNPKDGTAQEAVRLRFRKQGSTSWTTYSLTQTQQSYTLTSAQWTAVRALGPVVEWEAQTKGLFADYSPWSSTASVTIVLPPIATITAPSQGDNYDANRARLAWLYGQADDFPQTAWRAELLSGGVLLESSSGSGAATITQFQTVLTDLKTYVVRLQVQAAGIWSAWETSEFTVVFVPPPLPAIEGYWDDELGAHILAIAPGTGAPSTVAMWVDRSIDHGLSWSVLEANLGTSAVDLTDFQGLSRGDTLYRVTATAATGATSRTVADVPADSGAAWLAAGPDFSGPARTLYNPTRSRQAGRARSVQTYLQRDYPVAYAGRNLSETLEVGGGLLSRQVADQAHASEDEFVAVVQAPHPVHLYRDPEGRHVYASVGGLRLDRQNYAVTAWRLSLVRVDTAGVLEVSG